jgi:hypothetical protein
VTNTPAIVASLPKAASRRFKAAFAKLRLVTLTELGTHAPLAMRAAPVEESSEQALADTLWARVPAHSLVIGDRLFGTGKTIDAALRGFVQPDVELLVRVAKNLKPTYLKRLPDGSALIDVATEPRAKTSRRLREINARGIGRNGKAFTLRLWTTLLDPVAHPALTLAEHYVTRWEHELYHRELKLDVRHDPVLASHTVETALQELAALVLASHLIARLRIEAAARAGVAPTRISFYKLKYETERLWTALQWFGADLSPKQRADVLERYYDAVQRSALLKDRRPRSCPRVVRQPVTGWPRKTNQRSYTGDVSLQVIRA